MFPDMDRLGEMVFLSSEVARLARISLRQLQWWDERKLVTPRQEGRKRFYVPEQVLEILTVAALRQKGISLQKVRRILRLLRRGLEHQASNARSANSKLYLVTDGNSVFIEDQPEKILNRLGDADRPMYLVSLSEQIERIASKEAPRRYRSKQRPLFNNSGGLTRKVSGRPGQGGSIGKSRNSLNRRTVGRTGRRSTAADILTRKKISTGAGCGSQKFEPLRAEEDLFLTRGAFRRTWQALKQNCCCIVVQFVTST